MPVSSPPRMGPGAAFPAHEAGQPECIWLLLSSEGVPKVLVEEKGRAVRHILDQGLTSSPHGLQGTLPLPPRSDCGSCLDCMDFSMDDLQRDVGVQYVIFRPRDSSKAELVASIPAAPALIRLHVSIRCRRKSPSERSPPCVSNRTDLKPKER